MTASSDRKKSQLRSKKLQRSLNSQRRMQTEELVRRLLLIAVLSGPVLSLAAKCCQRLAHSY